MCLWLNVSSSRFNVVFFERRREISCCIVPNSPTHSKTHLFDMLKKIGIGFLILFVVLIAAVLIGARMVGAWNILFPSSQHETVRPAMDEDLSEPAMLVFSKTNGFRHIDGIEGGIQFFDGLAEQKGIGIFHTENSAVFNAEDLKRFSVVIFNNVTGDVLSLDQEQAFQTWLEAGGGWLGLHSAGDASHAGWPWYVENLIGANFTFHIMGPQFQDATVLTEDTSHVATRTLPVSWTHNEEWYSWDKSVRGGGFNILATVDENTYNPRLLFLGMDKDLRMGDHPVIWNRCVGNGRSLYSALGHSDKAYESETYQELLTGAVEWLMDASACAASE